MSRSKWCIFDPRTEPGRLYFLLLTLRILSCFFGYGYIHPDEWLQSGEPYFGLTQPNLDSRLTWEWRPDFALRSFSSLRTQYLAVPPLLSIFKKFGSISGQGLFCIQRANMLLWTVMLDISVVGCFPPKTARYILFLFGISTAATTFLVRPFSNSHEAHLIAFLLIQVLGFYRDRNWDKHGSLRGWTWGILPAMIAADGFFTRFTFAIFALPPAIFFGYCYARVVSEGYIRPAVVSLGIGLAALITTFWYSIKAETDFYTQLGVLKEIKVASLWETGWVIPPINALRYNVRTENVKEHGLHPRWLHAVVNLPMMVGVGNCIVIVICGWQLVKRMREWLASTQSSQGLRASSIDPGPSTLRLDKRQATAEAGHNGDERKAVEQAATTASTSDATISTQAQTDPQTEVKVEHVSIEKPALILSLVTIIFSLAILSISPHQEPRFLLALCFPSAIIFAYTLQSPLLTSRPTLTRTLVALHIIQHLLQLILFSFLHQAALLPTLFHIDHHLSTLPNTGFGRDEHHLIYRTFSVPYHLMPNKGRGVFPLVEHFDSSTTPEGILNMVYSNCGRSWMYAPTWVVQELKEEAEKGGMVELERKESFWWHVDMDHLGESWALVGKVGIGETFAIQKLEVRCKDIAQEGSWEEEGVKGMGEDEPLHHEEL